MATHTLSPTPGIFEVEFDKFISERRQVSDRLYKFLHALVMVMTACAVLFAACYGWQLGENLFYRLIIILVAVGIECSLVFFAAIQYPKPVLLVFGLISGTGVIAISMFTAASFMLSQQFAQDHKVEELAKGYMQQLQEDAGKLSVANAADRGSLAATRNRFEDVLFHFKDSQGSKATAIYAQIAKTTGSSVEVVSLYIRLFLALVFVSTTIALASYLETVYCPESLAKWIDQEKRRQELIKTAREDFAAIGQGRQVVHPQASPSTTPSLTPASRSPRSPTHDTETNGSNASRYERIKEGVKAGSIKPSVRGLKAQGMSQATAEKYLQQMRDEGVIQTDLVMAA